jgi:hypothetical protein
MSWLDRFFAGLDVMSEGTPQTTRPFINFIGAGVSAADNPDNESTDVTIPGAPTVGDWTRYTPTFSAAGGSPALGAGTIDAFYRLVGVASMELNLVFTAGAGTNFGTGALYFSLPNSITMDGTRFPAGNLIDLLIMGSGWLLDADSVANNKALAIYRGSSDSRLQVVPTGSITPVSGTAPFTMATGDVIMIGATIPIGGA